MIEDVPSSSLYLAFGLLQLRQGRKTVKIFGNIRIVNSAVVFCHSKGGMPKELLEHKRITATINQIFAGKGVAEQMDACFLNATGAIIVGNRNPQGVL